MVILGGVVVLLWAISGIATYPLQDRGTFGDMFGAVNALFSGLAFAGVIYTILLQRKELELQREELVATREELARSASAQESTERVLQKQVEAAQYSQRIAALNNMMTFAQQCYERTRTEPLNDAEKPAVEAWARRRMDLMRELEQVYGDLFKRDRKSG